MSLRLTYCKWLDRRISKYQSRIYQFQDMVRKIKIWIKKDEKLLKKHYELLDDVERIRFANDQGYWRCSKKVKSYRNKR